jgi:predicted AAA+ superfamily ATPase
MSLFIGNQAEIEFVITYKNKIIPIEAKSSESVRSRSLTEFRKKFQPVISIRYSMKNLKYEEGMLNIPLDMADYTEKLIQGVV